MNFSQSSSLLLLRRPKLHDWKLLFTSSIRWRYLNRSRSSSLNWVQPWLAVLLMRLPINCSLKRLRTLEVWSHLLAFGNFLGPLCKGIQTLAEFHCPSRKVTLFSFVLHGNHCFGSHNRLIAAPKKILKRQSWFYTTLQCLRLTKMTNMNRNVPDP
jgi:hypothetical protein